MQPFKSIPTLTQVANKVAELAHDLTMLSKGCGQMFASVQQATIENNEMTDAAIEELNLKVAFLMTIIKAKKPLNSGLTGVDGKVHYEEIPALELYLKGGRQMLIEKREAARKAVQDAEGLQAAETPGDDENLATASAGGAEANAVNGPFDPKVN